MRNKHYDKKYFLKRDNLDLHIAETLLLFLRERRLKNVLEVGCGTGRLVWFLNKKGLNIKGCDNSPVAVNIAKKINGNASIKKASAVSLPYKSHTFDMVCSISMIEHLTKSEGKKFISEVFRVLKRNGYIFLITPNFKSPMRYIFKEKWFGYSDPTHKHFYTPSSMNDLLSSSRFKNISFRLKSAKDVKYDWYLPSIFSKAPMFIRNFFNYLMISSPFSTYRDSFWVIATKK